MFAMDRRKGQEGKSTYYDWMGWDAEVEAHVHFVFQTSAEIIVKVWQNHRSFMVCHIQRCRPLYIIMCVLFLICMLLPPEEIKYCSCERKLLAFIGIYLFSSKRNAVATCDFSLWVRQRLPKKRAWSVWVCCGIKCQHTKLDKAWQLGAERYLNSKFTIEIVFHCVGNWLVGDFSMTQTPSSISSFAIFRDSVPNKP